VAYGEGRRGVLRRSLLVADWKSVGRRGLARWLACGFYYTKPIFRVQIKDGPGWRGGWRTYYGSWAGEERLVLVQGVAFNLFFDPGGNRGHSRWDDGARHEARPTVFCLGAPRVEYRTHSQTPFCLGRIAFLRIACWPRRGGRIRRLRWAGR